MPPVEDDGRRPAPPFEDQYHEVYFGAALASGGRAFLCHTRRWRRAAQSGRRGLTLFTIPGLGHNFDFFTPLAARLLAPGGEFADQVNEVIAVDLPGHGGSEMPRELLFGAVTLRHYVSAIRQVLADLKRRGRGVDVVVGHSMGGLLAMMVEQSLVSKARPTTLAERYGTRGVVLLAPTIPDSPEGNLLDWHLAEGDEENMPCPALRLLTPYITTSLRYGAFLHAAPEDYRLNFFGVRGARDEPVAEANAPDLITARTLLGIESYAACSEMCGLDLRTGTPFARPLIDRGLFKSYAYAHVSYSKDTLLLPSEQDALYQYLGGGERNFYLPADAGDASHNSPFSHPDYSDEAFDKVLAWTAEEVSSSEFRVSS